jgi:hypothetical protein
VHLCGDELLETLAAGPADGTRGVRRAGVTALTLFAVTVTLALLLEVLSYQAWPSVLLSISAGPLDPLPELTSSDPARIDPGRGGVIDVQQVRFTVTRGSVGARGFRSPGPPT